MFAPSRANNPAVARPMPRLPPVTTAILPSSRPMSGAASRHVAVMRLAMHAAPDRIDGDHIRGADARKVDFESIALNQPRRFFLRLDQAEFEQQVLVLAERRYAVQRFGIGSRHVLDFTAFEID